MQGSGQTHTQSSQRNKAGRIQTRTNWGYVYERGATHLEEGEEGRGGGQVTSPWALKSPVSLKLGWDSEAHEKIRQGGGGTKKKKKMWIVLSRNDFRVTPVTKKKRICDVWWKKKSDTDEETTTEEWSDSRWTHDQNETEQRNMFGPWPRNRKQESKRKHKEKKQPVVQSRQTEQLNHESDWLSDQNGRTRTRLR